MRINAPSGLSAARRLFRKQVHNRLVYAADGPRRFYAIARRLCNAPDAMLRQRMARSLRPVSSLAVAEADGYRVLPPGALELTETVVAATQRRCAEIGLGNLAGRTLESFSQAPAVRNGEWTVTGGRLGRLFDREALSPQSPFLRFALNPELLATVSAYLGVVPLLSGMDIWVSMPSDKIWGPQLFHCDESDERQLRVIVYASDVTHENGPLTLVAASISNQIRRAIDYRWLTVPDEDMVARAGEANCHPIVGPAGTVVLVDTCRCFHCGSRLQPGAGSRVAAMFQYSRPGAFYMPLRYRRKAPFRKHADAGALSPLQRLVLGGSGRGYGAPGIPDRRPGLLD